MVQWESLFASKSLFLPLLSNLTHTFPRLLRTGNFLLRKSKTGSGIGSLCKGFVRASFVSVVLHCRLIFVDICKAFWPVGRRSAVSSDKRLPCIAHAKGVSFVEWHPSVTMVGRVFGAIGSSVLEYSSPRTCTRCTGVLGVHVYGGSSVRDRAWVQWVRVCAAVCGEGY
jgi:hypothetical protein